MDRLTQCIQSNIYTIASYDSNIDDSHSDAEVYEWDSKSRIKRRNKSKFQVSAVR